MSANTELLKVAGLQMRFGGLLAVDGIDFDVRRDEVFAIIGPNGAGKTTVFNCVGGFYKPTGGDVVLDGHAIGGLPSHKIALKGLVRTFQNIRLFKSLTVVENLLVAQHRKVKAGLLPGLFSTPAYRRAEKEALERAAVWLDRMGLTSVANRPAGTLSYGHQRRLEIARCMITEPRLLLLDEPTLGLAPLVIAQIFDIIRTIRDEGVTVFLVEQNANKALGVADRGYVLETGRVVLADTGANLLANDRIKQAYLGG